MRNLFRRRRPAVTRTSTPSNVTVISLPAATTADLVASFEAYLDQDIRVTCERCKSEGDDDSDGYCSLHWQPPPKTTYETFAHNMEIFETHFRDRQYPEAISAAYREPEYVGRHRK